MFLNYLWKMHLNKREYIKKKKKTENLKSFSKVTNSNE